MTSSEYTASTGRYDTMGYSRTGRSGLKLPALSLGLWQNFGSARALETQQEIVRRAFDLGITHFDLANNYGPPPGSAEENFGRLYAQDLKRYRDEIIVSTKAGNGMHHGPYGDGGSRKHLLSSLDASLGRMGLDYVDIFYHHRPDAETPIEESMGALATAVHQGKALYVGVSNYTPEQTQAAAAALAEHKVPLVIHQPSYSMFNRHVEAGLLPILDNIGAGSIVFSPLAQGLLSGRYLEGRIPEGSRAANSHIFPDGQVSETYLARARGLQDIARRRGQTLAQLALTWVLRHPQVTSALIGASSVAQLEENAAALEASGLTTDELDAIEPYAVDGTHR